MTLASVEHLRIEDLGEALLIELGATPVQPFVNRDELRRVLLAGLPVDLPTPLYPHEITDTDREFFLATEDGGHDVLETNRWLMIGC